MKDNFRPSASQPNSPDEDRGPQDLTLLVEQHAKEVWALKQELLKASQELTVLDGTKQVVKSSHHPFLLIFFLTETLTVTISLILTGFLNIKFCET